MKNLRKLQFYLTLLLASSAIAEENISTRLAVKGNPKQEYFLIDPSQGEVPKDGYKLLLVLPGGSGTADFHPFVTNIAKHVAGPDYLVAQLISVKWTPEQHVIWPTEKSDVEEAKFSTEDYLEAVISEIKEGHKIDPKHIYTLSWSSGGPAAYAASLEVDDITGSFIAMSVFKPDSLPRLSKAKGHSYYLYHSEEDKVCPIRMARDAEEQLQGKGAHVKFTTYQGGHGWHGNFFPDLKAGISWLENQNSKK